MGRKFSYIITLLLILSYPAKGQKELNFRFVDTLTYYYYSKGDWKNLINLGNLAVNEGIDYKYLRQRMGYAYFISGDYIRSVRNFKKALQYDSYDPFTLGYLYYSYLDLLRAETAGYYSSRMTSDQRKSYQIKPTKLIESIDFELNTKITSTTLRSDARYYRFGLNSRPLQRLSLYQSVSAYNQMGTIQYPTERYRFQTRQFGYYGLIKYALFPHWNVKAAYHFIYSDFSSSITYSSLVYAGLSAGFDMLTLSMDASAFHNGLFITKQGGLKAGLSVPGKKNLSLTSGITVLNQQDTSSLIYSMRAGIKLNNKIHMTADVAYGYQNYYNDFDAMYVYNSIDPGTFRTGLTTYFLTKERIAFWINIGFERNEYFENKNYNYNQISFLGGVQWRL